MKTVNPQNLPLIDYRTLIPFQQNLKDLETERYDKLLSSFKKHGYFVPAYVWFNDGKPYILDAHQRHRVLMHEEIEFENTGFEIPYVEIAADGEKDAKEKLLLITSQYGHITQDGLDEFAFDLELDQIDYSFDAIPDFLNIDEASPDEPDNDLKPKVVRYTIDELKSFWATYIGLQDRPPSFITWLENESR